MIYLIAFISGAAVMSLELVGPRLIAVYYGSTIYTWSSMIGVTLLALSAGYALGGRVADRHPKILMLGWVLTGAAALVFSMVGTRDAVILLTQPLGIRWGAFTCSLILLFPAMLLLGMVAPLCIRLTATSKESIGKDAGAVLGISTAGSFVGTILTGFYLIPSLGVREMILLWMGVLAALAVLCFMASFLKSRARVPLLLVGANLGLIVYVAGQFILPQPYPYFERGQVIFMTDSHYGQIKVVDVPPTRIMLVNNGIQTHWNMKRHRTQSGYVNYLHYLLMARPDAKTLLNVGMGGGNIPKLFSGKYGLTVDVVEIDGRIPKVAYDYFGLLPDMMRDVFVEDGRSYIERSSRSYDLMVLDAFIGGTHPWQLLTAEAFVAMKDNLTPGGVLAISIPGAIEGSQGRIAKAVVKTLSGIFQEVKVFAQAPDQNESLFLVMASDDDLEAIRSPENITDDALALLYLRRMIAKADVTRQLDLDGAALLTDNLTAVTKWEWRAEERWREDMMTNNWDRDIYLHF